MPEGPQAPTTTEEVYAPPTIVEHPALVKEETYEIASKSSGAVVVVNLQGKTDDDEWNDATKIITKRYKDFPAVEVPAVGTEGEPGYVAAHTIPAYTLVLMPDGTEYQLDGHQIANDANAFRDSMVTTAIAQSATYQIPVGLNYLQFGVLFDYVVQQMVAADKAAKAAQE